LKLTKNVIHYRENTKFSEPLAQPMYLWTEEYCILKDNSVVTNHNYQTTKTT